MRTSDVGVIGAGVIGLATAVHIIDRGASVTVYERGEPGNAQSGGVTRLFRHAHDDPRLIRLARRSRQMYTEWEERFGVELVSDDGIVAIGPHAERRLPLMQQAGVAARAIDADELAERMPLLAPFDGPALIDDDGGAIRVRNSIAVLTGLLGDAIVTDEVLTVRPTTAGTVEVRAGGVTSEHGAVVVCAGTATSAFARTLGIDIPVKVSAILRPTFAVAGERPRRVAGLQDSSGSFGEVGGYGVGISSDDRGEFVAGIRGKVQAERDLRLDDVEAYADFERRITAYVARALPGLDPNPVSIRHCWLTELPWGYDAFGVWGRDNVVIPAGNNLYKFAPVLGAGLAEAALSGEIPGEFSPAHRLGDAGITEPG